MVLIKVSLNVKSLKGRWFICWHMVLIHHLSLTKSHGEKSFNSELSNFVSFIFFYSCEHSIFLASWTSHEILQPVSDMIFQILWSFQWFRFFYYFLGTVWVAIEDFLCHIASLNTRLFQRLVRLQWFLEKSPLSWPVNLPFPWNIADISSVSPMDAA